MPPHNRHTMPPAAAAAAAGAGSLDAQGYAARSIKARRDYNQNVQAQVDAGRFTKDNAPFASPNDSLENVQDLSRQHGIPVERPAVTVSPTAGGGASGGAGASGAANASTVTTPATPTRSTFNNPALSQVAQPPPVQFLAGSPGAGAAALLDSAAATRRDGTPMPVPMATPPPASASDAYRSGSTFDTARAMRDYNQGKINAADLDRVYGAATGAGNTPPPAATPAYQPLGRAYGSARIIPTAQPDASATAPAATSVRAQQMAAAIKAYPALAQAGSAQNKAFTDAYTKGGRNDSSILSLAHGLFGPNAANGGTASGQTPAASGSNALAAEDAQAAQEGKTTFTQNPHLGPSPEFTPPPTSSTEVPGGTDVKAPALALNTGATPAAPVTFSSAVLNAAQIPPRLGPTTPVTAPSDIARPQTTEGQALVDNPPRGASAAALQVIPQKAPLEPALAAVSGFFRGLKPASGDESGYSDPDTPSAPASSPTGVGNAASGAAGSFGPALAATATPPALNLPGNGPVTPPPNALVGPNGLTDEERRRRQTAQAGQTAPNS